LSSLPGLQALLLRFSEEMLEAGAPAVLIQAKVGQEEWTHVAGVRSPADSVPAEPSDQVHVGGVTETLVAISVLKLVNEGKLVLDEPMTTYVPELEGLVHPPGPMPVGTLLFHTSGMPDYYSPLLQSAPHRQVLATPLTATQRLTLAGSVPWPQRLAQGFEYSRSNYVALGMIVERLRGRPLAEVLRTDVIEPLGLSGTALTDVGPLPDTLVHGSVLIGGEPVDTAFAALHAGSAAEGLVSTVQDLNTLFKALMRGDLLGPPMVNEMKGPIYAPYGLGIDRWNDTCTNGFYYGRHGDVPGYGTIAMSSADGIRQVAIAVAYPPSPLPTVRPNAISPEMVELAEDALNSTCRGLQFRWEPAVS
jgi:D-alanyl-D-alanine carboxypeptidase